MIHEVQRETLTDLPASAYSVTTLMGYEPWVDDTIRLFLERLDEKFIRAREPCDFDNWLQYCMHFRRRSFCTHQDVTDQVIDAYDVIGVITMSRPMGFLQAGEDIGGMLHEIKAEARYRALVSHAVRSI